MKTTACLTIACVLGTGIASEPAQAHSSNDRADHAAHLTISAPARIAPGGVVIVTGRVSGLRGKVEISLQRREGSAWRTVAHNPARRGVRKYLLHTHVPAHGAGTLQLRVLAFGGHRQGTGQLTLSRLARVEVNKRAPTVASASTRAISVPAGAVRSAPAPGSSGSVVLDGVPSIQPGSVLAAAIGPSTPNGLLDKVDSVVTHDGTTTAKVSPATLQEALPEGSFELSQATPAAAAAASRKPSMREDNGTAAPADGGMRPRARIASDDEGIFNEDLAKSFSCAGGASFSATGEVGLSATPKLKISWSLFKGVSASFTETVSAKASLTGKISAAASCTFAKTPLLSEPALLGSFVGDVFGLPVVVTIEGQIYLDGEASVQGGVSAGVSGETSASGGISYAGGKVSAIAPHASLKFGAQGPTLEGSATLGAHLTPELQVLLYGVGGPVFDAKTGLDLNANVGSSPWWTLTAPLQVSARLAIPALDLSTPSLTLYSHTFTVAKASGAFPGASKPTPPTPPASVPASGPTLVYDGATAGSEFDGDTSFTDWSTATGQPAPVEAVLPANLTGYRCVVLLMNQSLGAGETAALTGYLHAGGTILAIGEHEDEMPIEEGEGAGMFAPGGFDDADHTLNGFLGSLGAGLSINDDSLDEGPFVTANIYPSPLTAGVGSIGYNWVSSVTVSGSAQPLVATAEDTATFIGAQSIDGGTLIASGDSNVFSDNSEDAYEVDGNGQFVRDICP